MLLFGLEVRKVKNSNGNHKGIQLPEAFMPMLAGNPDGFIARMEGQKLIFEPKPKANHGSGNREKPHTTVQARNGRKGAAGAESQTAPAGRPSFLYTVKDRRLSLEQAKRYGLSPTRLKVLQAVYKAKRGLQAREIMTKCNLPHGSVQQTLHWLRSHQMIDHTVLG